MEEDYGWDANNRASNVFGTDSSIRPSYPQMVNEHSPYFIKENYLASFENDKTQNLSENVRFYSF